MDKMNLLKYAGLGVVAFTTQQKCLAIEEIQKPNVVFILADDLTYNGINALNNPEVHTPNLNKLVNNGTSFVNTHIFGANSPAVSAPSRAMLLTGRTFNELPQGFVVTWSVPKNKRGVCPYKTFPEVFRANGYRTFATGKQHNGTKTFYRGFTDGGKIFFNGMHTLSRGGHYKPWVNDFEPSGNYPKPYQENKFSTVLFTDAALKFLDEYKDSKPYMMYVAYTSPHDPRQAPQKYIDMYPPEKITLPKNFYPKHPFNNGSLGIRDELLAPIPRTKKRIKQEIGGYYAMITQLDDQVGRIMKKIEEKGQMDNTIFVFSGDNGLAVGQHGLLGKQNLYEHSIGVPLIFSGKGIPKGKKIDSLCYLHDLFPTFCDLIGAKTPSSITSKSLLPLLQGKKKEIYKTQFYCYGKQQRAFRKGDWKLIRYKVKNKETTQLFNIRKDHLEIKNLANNIEFRAKLKEMETEMAKAGAIANDNQTWYQ